MNKTLFAKELRANLFVSGIIAAVLAMYIGLSLIHIWCSSSMISVTSKR